MGLLQPAQSCLSPVPDDDEAVGDCRRCSLVLPPPLTGRCPSQWTCIAPLSSPTGPFTLTYRPSFLICIKTTVSALTTAENLKRRVPENEMM